MPRLGTIICIKLPEGELGLGPLRIMKRLGTDTNALLDTFSTVSEWTTLV